eukprot:SAG22_NODE_704_length_7777_cov_6.153295_6_plen_102_part_00
MSKITVPDNAPVHNLPGPPRPLGRGGRRVDFAGLDVRPELGGDDRQKTRKGTALDRTTVEAQQKGTALLTSGGRPDSPSPTFQTSESLIRRLSGLVRLEPR